MREILKDIAKLYQMCYSDYDNLEKRITRFVKPIENLIPNDEFTDNLFLGLELNLAFCMFEDRIIDDEFASRGDAFFALLFHSEYIKWLSDFCLEKACDFNSAVQKFIEYTKKEHQSIEYFNYNFETYLQKEMPLIMHIDLMDTMLKCKYGDVFVFVKHFYTVVLLVDDMEDFEIDVKNNINTIITANLYKSGINLNSIKIKQKKYWQCMDIFLSDYLLNILQKYKKFEANDMYQYILGIYKSIRLKCDQ